MKPLPALCITTADHDDRVVPLHSFKMAATLQAGPGAASTQSNPLIVRIDVKVSKAQHIVIVITSSLTLSLSLVLSHQAGHGAGKPTAKILDEYADTFGFAAHYTGATWTDTKATKAAAGGGGAGGGAGVES